MEIFKNKILVVFGFDSPYILKDIGRGGYGEGVESIPNIPNKGKLADKNLINKVKAPGSSKENILKKAEDIDKKAKNIHKQLKFVEIKVGKQKVRIDSIPYIWPTKGYLTSYLGWRMHPLTGKRDYHNGQDIATQYGNKVVATGSGVVMAAEHWVYLGNLVIIDHGFGFTTRYAHLASFNVKPGDRVKRFQVIGYVGNSGRSSAPHLHYEVRYFGKPLNPMNFIID